MLSNGCCCGVETFVWWQHAFPWWSISLVNYGCNHQRTTASTNFLCSHKILCNAHNTCMSKTTMLDTRISSAAHILMENVTVIFLNTTQAEPLCDRRWRKWADFNWWTFITSTRKLHDNRNQLHCWILTLNLVTRQSQKQLAMWSSERPFCYWE